ncbi:hypothetical protein D3C74_495050 [compost metagenome]
MILIEVIGILLLQQETSAALGLCVQNPVAQYINEQIDGQQQGGNHREQLRVAAKEQVVGQLQQRCNTQ